MIMDCEKYVGKCVCGRDHELETKKVVVEYGAINNFEQYMADVGLAGKKRAVIYDTVIYKLTEGKHVAADQEIVLEANGLRAEDTVIEEMMKKLDNPEVIVAYGAATRHTSSASPLSPSRRSLPPTASRQISARQFSTARRSPLRCALQSSSLPTLTL